MTEISVLIRSRGDIYIERDSVCLTRVPEIEVVRRLRNMSGRDRVLLGTILAAHGIRGDVLIKTFTGDPMDIGSYGELTDGAGGRPISIRPRRLNAKGGLIAAVQGVTDRNGAEALKGAELWVSREQLPEPDDEEES